VADSVIETREEAVAFLDRRIGWGVKPGLERITGLLDFMGDPHRQYPVIHVAGTNGKTTATRMISGLLGAHGLRTGSFTSPHLHRVEERFQLDGEPISAQRLITAVSDVAWFVEEYERRSGEGVTYFEVTTAIALGLFADAAVDVAVIEVGMGGRWDATNVVDGDVAVITGISLDHTAHLGSTIGEIAAEKAAILKSRSLLVTGPLPAAAEGPITARVAETGSRWLRSDSDFGVEDPALAVAGWQATIRGVEASYDRIYLPLHGRHQIEHLATSIAAAEAFVERPLDPELVLAAAAATTSPGRLEVAGHRPLVVLDGAHNEEGFRGLATALGDEFPALPWHLVIGVRGDRAAGELAAPLRGMVHKVWATQAGDESAVAAVGIAPGLGESLGVDVEVVEEVPAAVAAAKDAAGADGGVVVAGSLYVVGEARVSLLGDELGPSGVHVRYELPDEEDDEGYDDGGGYPLDLDD
jgi:dihydrofolate synthase / folylpolyglutamate synthase